MARTSTRITITLASILISTVLAGCGGSGGTPSGSAQLSSSGSSGTSGTLASSTSTDSTATGNSGSTSNTASGSASTSTTMSLDQLPYVDPAPLEDLMRLGDADYKNQLDNNWSYVGPLLDRYVPPDVTLYPVPNGFYGPMASCKQYHGVVACREHMNQLIGLMRSKAPAA